jgi:hypothetical protein
MGDRTRGLYDKFYVERNDGSSAEGEKHDGCEYFVLDLDHDKHALAALEAYAASCEKEYPLLATDLRAKVAFLRELEAAMSNGADRRKA